MSNTIHSVGTTIDEVAAAGIATGTFDFTASGIAKFYGARGKQGGDILAGETTAVTVAGVVVKIDKEDATDVYAQGADVFGNTTTQDAFAVGPEDGLLGYAAEPSANGDAQVAVRLNGIPGT